MSGINSGYSPVSQLDKAGTDLAAFLTISSEYALNVFSRHNQFLSKIFVKNIRGAKAEKFPRVGNAKGKAYTKGDFIYDSANSYAANISRSDMLISVDNTFLVHEPIDELDNIMNDFDTISAYIKSLSEDVSRNIDRKILRAMIIGARAATAHADVSGYDKVAGGTTLKLGDDVLDTESVLRAGIKEAAITLDEQDVPKEDRFVVLSPRLARLLTANNTIIGTEWGGQKAAELGIVNIVEGVNVLSSNNLPTDNTLSNDEAFGTAINSNTYHGDFRNTIGVVFQGQGLSSPVGGLMAIPITTDIDMKPSGFLAHMLMLKYAGGFSHLRPECLIELSSATATA
jgi:hypothetical protein